MILKRHFWSKIRRQNLGDIYHTLQTGLVLNISVENGNKAPIINVVAHLFVSPLLAHVCVCVYVTYVYVYVCACMSPNIINDTKAHKRVTAVTARHMRDATRIMRRRRVVIQGSLWVHHGRRPTINQP